MLLHVNGSFPSIPGLNRFWESNVSEKVKCLRNELQEMIYN